MRENYSNEVLEAVQKDDVKAFRALNEEFNAGVLRFGRFPLLSVIYLFSARKIAKEFEEKYFRINSFTELSEPFSISSAFRKKAGKAARIYLETVISPIEMLVLLGDTKRAELFYSVARPSAAQRDRMESVYSLLYSSDITYRDDDILFGKRPLSARKKKQILIAAISSFLCVAICVATPFVVNAFVPLSDLFSTDRNRNSSADITDNEAQTDPSDINNDHSETDIPGTATDTEKEQPSEENVQPTEFVTVSSPAQINFSSATTKYTLESDIVLESTPETVACEIDGAGHTLTMTNESFDEITGSLENVNIEIQRDVTVTENLSFIAKKNSGTIKSVAFSYRGTVIADGQSDEIVVAGFVLENNGVIEGCSADWSVQLVGNAQSNGIFSGIVGTNDKNTGKITDCTVTGTIAANTFDVAGLCVYNGNIISGSTNAAYITHTTAEKDWNPVTAGIALYNHGSILSSVNEGDLTVTTTEERSEESVSSFTRVAGITVYNVYSSTYNFIPQLDSCSNKGKITVHVKNKKAHAGGIVAYTAYSSVYSSSGYSPLSSLTNEGNISVLSENNSAYAAGICVALSAYSISASSCSNTAFVTAESGYSYDDACEILAGGFNAFSFADDSYGFFTLRTNLSQCSNSGEIKAKLSSTPAKNSYLFAGGLSAFESGISYNTCSNTNKVTAKYIQTEATGDKIEHYEKAGGIAGNGSSSSFYSCSNTSSVFTIGKATSHFVGGITGDGQSSSFSGCVNSGSVRSEEAENNVIAGGIVGEGQSSSIGKCTNNGSVVVMTAKDSVILAGIAGECGATSQCVNQGNLSSPTATETHVGGVVGIAGEDITYSICFSDITVTEGEGLAYVGGIASKSSYTLKGCYQKGNITVGSSTSYVGGILGCSTVFVSNSVVYYNGSRVHPVYSGTLSYCIAKGNISSSGEKSYVGGLCGTILETLYQEDTVYYGGSIGSSFFIGTSEATHGTAGSIVGLMAKNITLKENETHLSNNYYSSENSAIGAYRNGEEITAGDDNGCEKKTEEEIPEIELYQQIINYLSPLTGESIEQTPEVPPEENTDPGSGAVET